MFNKFNTWIDIIQEFGNVVIDGSTLKLNDRVRLTALKPYRHGWFITVHFDSNTLRYDECAKIIDKQIPKWKEELCRAQEKRENKKNQLLKELDKVLNGH